MRYSNLSFRHFCADKNQILSMTIVSWTFSILFGMFLSFWIVPKVSIDVTSFFDNGPSTVLGIVSLGIYIFTPIIVFRFWGVNSFLILFLPVYKGILTGFLLTTLLLSFGAYAWLISCLLQATETLCMAPIFVIWIFCFLRDINKMYLFIFLTLVLWAVVWPINSVYISRLIKTILCSVI